MANTYAQGYVIAQSEDFLARVEIALIQQCVGISVESTGVANHTLRLALMEKILLNSRFYAGIFAKGIVSDGTTDNTSTDAALLTRLGSIYNTYLDY